MLYDVILHTFFCNFSIHTQRERKIRKDADYTIHILGGCFSLNHPTNLTLQHFPGTPAPVWPDVSTLPVYYASCHSQGHVGVSPRSHRTPGIVFFLNEANGKSIFVLDILDQPLHIYTIPCICVLYKNHQVLESGHHHNVHGRHRRHIYDDKSTIIRRLSH